MLVKEFLFVVESGFACLHGILENFAAFGVGLNCFLLLSFFFVQVTLQLQDDSTQLIFAVNFVVKLITQHIFALFKLVDVFFESDDLVLNVLGFQLRHLFISLIFHAHQAFDF